MKYKKWWMPPLLTLISAAVFTGSFYLLPMLFDRLFDNAWASLPFLLLSWGLWLVVLLPILSLIYSKRALLDEKYRILLTVYNSVLIILPCFLRLGFGGLGWLLLASFVWAELWAVGGILVKVKK